MQINSFNQVSEYGLPIDTTSRKKDPVVEKKQPESPSSQPVKAEARPPETLKKVLSEHNITLQFSRDDETKQLVVKLVDDKTGEAIRQIPSEVSLRLAAASGKAQGQLINEEL